MLRKFIAIQLLVSILIISGCSKPNLQEHPMEENLPNTTVSDVEKTPIPTMSDVPKTPPPPTAKPTISQETPVPTADDNVKANEIKKDANTNANTNVDYSKYNSIDNKGSGWGFKKNKGSEPDIYDSTKTLLNKYDAYYMDQTKPKALYLTFDEGYENGYTGKILDTLKKCDVPAAFFVTGPYIKEQSELIHRMINEGHIVGNHTVKHPNLPKLSSGEKMANELLSLETQFEELYGYKMKYMRPPEGEYSERLLSVAQDLGYKTVLWSFAYRDWNTDEQKGAAYAFDQVTPYLHDGAILLLHAVSKDNTEALESIITYAKSQGYEFRSLDELK